MTDTTEPTQATRLAFVDTETTGLDPDRHEVWEVAIIETNHWPPVGDDDGGRGRNARLVVTDVWRALRSPARLEFAEPVALRIGRFHDRIHEVDDATDRFDGTHGDRDIAAQIEPRLRDRVMVGNVPAFDAAFLTRLLHSGGQPVTWHYQLVDVEALAAGWLMGAARGRPDTASAATAMPRWRSDDLLALLDVDVATEDRHTALGDAWWALRAYAEVYDAEIDTKMVKGR